MWMRWENKIHILTLHVILTTVEVYAWYAIKIYKKQTENYFQKEGAVLDPHLIISPCNLEMVYVRFIHIETMYDRFNVGPIVSTFIFGYTGVILKWVPRRKWVPRESHMSPTRNRAIYWCKKDLYRQNIIKYT